MCSLPESTNKKFTGKTGEGEKTSMDALVTSLVTGITGFVSSALSAIGQIVPAALPIFGAGMIITIAIATMRKLQGSRG